MCILYCDCDVSPLLSHAIKNLLILCFRGKIKIKCAFQNYKSKLNSERKKTYDDDDDIMLLTSLWFLEICCGWKEKTAYVKSKKLILSRLLLNLTQWHILWLYLFDIVLCNFFEIVWWEKEFLKNKEFVIFVLCLLVYR